MQTWQHKCAVAPETAGEVLGAMAAADPGAAAELATAMAEANPAAAGEAMAGLAEAAPELVECGRGCCRLQNYQEYWLLELHQVAEVAAEAALALRAKQTLRHNCCKHCCCKSRICC